MEEKLPKGFVDYHVNETTMMESSIPADYSFNNYEESVGIDAPRSTRVGRIPERGSQHRRYLTRSIWLNNNKLTNIRNADVIVNSILEQPEKLGWIDFSFNYITELDESFEISKFKNNNNNNNNKLTNIRNIDVMVNSILEQPEKLGFIDLSFNHITELDESITKFPNLKIIHLHGNLIKDIHEVFKLRGLSKLRSITFHGNPIADNPSYRIYIITYLPQILNLDFSPATIKEKLHAKPADAMKRILLVKNKNKAIEMNK